MFMNKGECGLRQAFERMRRTYDTESNTDLFVNGRPKDNSFASDMGKGA
jgi:hypothetical protein